MVNFGAETKNWHWKQTLNLKGNIGIEILLLKKEKDPLLVGLEYTDYKTQSFKKWHLKIQPSIHVMLLILDLVAGAAV